jgi:hypothetical protein
MDDTSQIEEIIREIATKHGIVVSRDDPILILQTINNRLLLDSAKAQQAMLDRFKEQLEDLALRWGNDAKGRAEQVLNAALAASKGVMAQSMEDLAKSAATSVAVEIDGALQRIARPVQDARRVALFNLTAACLTMCSAATVLFSVLH